MITAKEATELQEANYTKKISAKVEEELTAITNLIVDQTYRKYNYVYYNMPQDGPVDEIIKELKNNGYTVSNSNNKYKIEWN